ncbi:uncharacterized protein LOC135708289 [Ochlerotatus camptorhynchus]|uniref:uncharacterized protein LOC135708289 n=1 Tax=Ochlerotatus camptorhynchus TaxID=644619 RepID=UPI0031DF0D78
MRMNITVLAVLVIFSALEVYGADDDFNIDVKQKNAEVYHEQSAKNNEFNYGYQVEKENSQFQHKVKGPDDVTYGCYGYIDPNNEKHLVYYVADRLGYRLVPPNQPTKIFTERVASSINKLNIDLKDKKVNEQVVAWNDLYLPDSCRRLDEILTITTPPTQSGKINSTDSLSLFNQTKNVHLSPNTPNIATIGPTSRTIPPNMHSSSTTESNKLTRTDSRTLTSRTQGLFTTESVKFANDVPPTTTGDRDSYLHTKPSIVASTADNNFDQGAKHPITSKTSTRMDGPEGYTYATPKNPLPDCQQQNSPVLGQYNGFVYPIHGECSTSEYNVNQLMIQMEAVNKQVLELTANIRALQQNNLTSSTPEDSACRQWLTRQQFPLLIYVPILLPYLGGDFDSGRSQQSFKNPASYAFQKMCEDCINK